jgi:hypothetical protein
LLNVRDQVGLLKGRSMGCVQWTDLIGRTGINTIYSISDPTLGLNAGYIYLHRLAVNGDVQWWVGDISRLGRRRSPGGRILHSSTSQLNLSRFPHETTAKSAHI